jgi:hypothetical protein
MEHTSNPETPASESVEIADPTFDPVALLRSFGIEAELVAVVEAPMAPAA